MQFHAQGMAPYQVTEDDVLWFLRAVEAEGAVETEVAAALINCFCFTYSKGYKRTFTEFVRAYAQPINPRWFITGDLFLKDMKRIKPTPEQLAKQEAKALYRERVMSTRTEFTSVAQKAVVAALSGNVKIPPNATDYAAAFLDASHKYKPLAPATAGKNRLWARKNTENWQGVTVNKEEVQPWLASLSTVRLERAFDREFNTEVSKVNKFYANNAKGYTNEKKQPAIKEVKIDVGEVNTYSDAYIPALVQKETNAALNAIARAEEMQSLPRAAHYEAAGKNNRTSEEQWARQQANHTRAVNSSEKPLVVANALGFDFITGTWSVSANGNTKV